LFQEPGLPDRRLSATRHHRLEKEPRTSCAALFRQQRRPGAVLSSNNEK
jgi:hypothetical protein